MGTALRTSVGRVVPRPLLAALAVVALLALLVLPTSAAAPLDRSSPGGSGSVPSISAATFEVSGAVVDAYSGAPLVHLPVLAETASASGTVLRFNTTTDAAGAFVFYVPAGSLAVSVSDNGYAGESVQIEVSGPVHGLLFRLTPTALLDRLSGQAAWAPIAGLLVGVPVLAGALVAVRIRQRRAAGLSTRLLSSFGRFVVERLLLLPVQLLGLLMILYIFGTFLPALARANLTGCLQNSQGACAACDPSAFTCQIKVFGFGFYAFAKAIFTGNWGLASIGNLRLPAVDFVQWWLPYSLELAVVALALSLAIGFPLGLAAGWRSEGPLDRGLRGTSLTLLLVPTFLVVLFVLILIYTGWIAQFGDTPYGLVPSSSWYLAHGGFQHSWITDTGQTMPTGFPLIDALYHGDWGFFVVAGAKTLLQALVISLIYVAIFFRYARSAVTDAARSEAIRAARARGVPEGSLQWRHTGRRVLPVYLLTFGMTLPAYLGTQAVVEALFQDTPGFGTILFAEMTQVGETGFGFGHLGHISYGNLYQVTIFLLALLLLVGHICSDILARYLDPTLSEEARR
jgi:ABC-type dipeptide/oligopeptide/nickel transport system permease component